MKTFYDMEKGEFIREEVGVKKSKEPDFSRFWPTSNARRRWRPEPKMFLGQRDIIAGETYSVKPFYERDDE